MPHPGCLITQKETRYPWYKKLSGLQGSVCTGAENLTPIRVPAPNLSELVSHYANYTLLAALE
jgi:hypothetical protein